LSWFVHQLKNLYLINDMYASKELCPRLNISAASQSNIIKFSPHMSRVFLGTG